MLGPCRCCVTSPVPAGWSGQPLSAGARARREWVFRGRFLGEVTQDSFVEGGEGVEFGGGEQVDEMPADVVHVLGRCVLNGPASGGQ